MQEITKTFRTICSYKLRLSLVGVLSVLPVVALAQAQDAAVIGVPAKVNRHVITESEVSFFLTPILKKLQKQFPSGGEEFEKRFTDARKDVIQGLIDRHLLIDQFSHLKIEIAPKSINDEAQREVRENYNGDADQLRDAVKASQLTMGGLRTLLRDRLLEREIKKQQP